MRRRESGIALLAAAAIVFAALAALLLLEHGVKAAAARRDRATERALAEAREALIAYAADRPLTAAVGPGYLPCPDLDDDGWAEPTCGSLEGDRGQDERLGRLPWKTLGLADLRDGHGERLWYAVSTRHKGLLNCAASAGCVDMTPASALGTITVRDPSGAAFHDGTGASGAAAVVIAPGPAISRGAREQRRDCEPGQCDAARCLTEPPQRAARCDPRNYLDRAPAERSGEDNAGFRDRAGARAGNADGFIHGPVLDSDGRVAVNDRLAVVAYDDLMPRVMARIARELAHCLRLHAAQPQNAGRYPAPAPACGAAAPYGRVPDMAFAGAGACEAFGDAEGPAWWRGWKRFVFYAPCPAPGACLELADAAGRTIAVEREAAVVVSTTPDLCATPRLECDAARCRRVLEGARTRAPGDVVVAIP